MELNFLVLKVKNTTAAMNQSLQDLVKLIQDVSRLCEIASRTSNSAFYFLDQVRMRNPLFAYGTRIKTVLH